jgi:rare lipoprotein A (peptidoglycan hydrolase)
MSTLKKNIIGFVVLVLVADVGVAAWFLAHDLKSRFPHLDFSRSSVGIASWYSKNDKGINLETANGERFDDRKMTCASWDYPFGEKLIVINALTGKWVVCRVNDRGPNKRLFRKVDLTYAAFKRIANPKRGLIYATVIPTDKQRLKSV